MAVIRPATGQDAEAIRQIHLRAFPTAVEANLVEQLHADGDAVISLVAADDQQLVGHVLLSRMSVEADGRPLDSLALAPIAVDPDYQRRGVGSALVRAALAEARSAGAEILFLLGDPQFYARFGFSADAARPFASPYTGPYFQAAVVAEDWGAPVTGTAAYPQAFADLS